MEAIKCVKSFVLFFWRYCRALIKHCGEAATEGVLKKGVLKNFAKFFFNKVAGLRHQRNLLNFAVEILKVNLGSAPGNKKNAIPEVAAQSCSYEKAFGKYAADLQENTHAKV